MAFIDDFSDMLTGSLTVAPFVSRDRTGQPTYGAAVAYSCRYVEKMNMVRNQNGDEVVSRSNAVLLGNPAISTESKVTSSYGEELEILSVSRPADETGEAAYTRLYFK